MIIFVGLVSLCKLCDDDGGDNILVALQEFKKSTINQYMLQLLIYYLHSFRCNFFSICRQVGYNSTNKFRQFPGLFFL
jgi:hypothetical protein